MMDMPEVNQHALNRWAERCDGLSLAAEWVTVRRCGRKTKQKVMRSCPAHAHLMRGYQGFWYGISRNRVIFVVDQNQRVVTVFRLEAPQEQAA